MEDHAGKLFEQIKIAELWQFEEGAKRLGDGMERPATVENLVKASVEFQSVDRHFDDTAFVELMTNRDA